MTGELDKLTDRERQCLRLVHQGFESKEIASRLGISTDRVNKLNGSAMRKLGVSRRAIAARLLLANERPRIGVAEANPTHLPGGMPMGVPCSSPTTAERATDETNWLEQAKEGPTGFSTVMAVNPPLPSLVLPRPFRGERRPFNDLNRRSTLVAISLIAMAATASAGAGASLLLVLNWLLAGP